MAKDNWVQIGTEPVILRSMGSTVVEQLASHGGTAVVGICLAWGALLGRKVLASIGRGQPFHHGNAARIAGVAGLIVVATVAAEALPYLAARMVLDRLSLGGTKSPLVANLAIPISPFLVALLLLVFAHAFRRGMDLAGD